MCADQLVEKMPHRYRSVFLIDNELDGDIYIHGKTFNELHDAMVYQKENGRKIGIYRIERSIMRGWTGNNFERYNYRGVEIVTHDIGKDYKDYHVKGWFGRGYTYYHVYNVHDLDFVLLFIDSMKSRVKLRKEDISNETTIF